MTADQSSTARLDVPLEVLEARIREGVQAEYRHLLYDADPDATVPAFPYLIKSRPEGSTS